MAQGKSFISGSYKVALAAIVAAPLLALGISAAPACAQTTGPGYVDFTFQGTVQIKRDDSITLRNPDGSSTTIPSNEIPAYKYNEGDTLKTTFRVFTTDPNLNNAACGGRFKLTFDGGACTVSARVFTPFGEAGWNDDYRPVVSGLELVKDPQSGAFSLDMPTGSYTMGYVGIPTYFYDSATGTMTAPTGNSCVTNPYACQSSFTGNANEIYFGPIPVVGNFGQNPQGLNYGYNAGSGGIFSIVGNFLTSGGGSSGGTPNPVPEPGMALLFGSGAIAALWLRRRKPKAV